MNDQNISAQMVEQAFAKSKKRFLTLNQLRDHLPAHDRKKLGVTKKTTPKHMAALLKNLSGPYAVIKKGTLSYLIGAPLEELLETFFSGSGSGKSVGQAAQSLPMTKPDIISTANQLLKMGRLRAEISPSEKVKLYPEERDQIKISSGAAKAAEAHADPADALKSVYDRLASGKRHVYIYKIRRQLDWPRQKFDRLLDELMTEGRVAGYPGDPSRLSADQVKDSFQGRDGELYIAVAWRR